MEEEKNTNKKIVITIITITLVVLGIIGATVAYFLAQEQGKDFTITSETLKINFEDGTDIINTENLLPIEGDKYLKEGMKKTFTISKENDNKNLYARMDLTDLSLSTEAKTRPADIKWALYEQKGETENKISTGSFLQTKDGDDTIINMTTNIEITEDAKTFNLYVWIEETGVDQSTLIKGSLTGKVSVTGVRRKSNTLVSNILGDNNKNVSSSTTPTFTAESTDKGLFKLEDNNETKFGFPIYYYKGNVDNNYVSFGTYKSSISNSVYESGNDAATKKTVANSGSSILWRIVRINEDGSITLISEYNIDGDNTSWNSESNVEYFHPAITDGDSTDSEIKKAMDNWYKTTFTEPNVNNKIGYSTYCNDKSEDYGAVKTRLEKTPATPTLKCQEEDKVLEKIGLISADEIVYSGALYNTEVTGTDGLTYMNNSTDFWTMSPYETGKVLLWKGNNKHLNSDAVSNTSAAPRPVITLKADVVIVKNNGSSDTLGTKTNPYVIKVN